MRLYEQWRNRALIPAINDFAHELGEEYQEEFTRQQWQWNGTTRRRNGQVVSSPRDIVDLGNLKKSQQIDFSKLNADELEFSYIWDGNGQTPAVVVHEGNPLKNYPARHWTIATHNRINLAELMRQNYDRHAP